MFLDLLLFDDFLSLLSIEILMRSSDLFDPVDGLKRLPKGWCLNKVFNFEKWSDKRDHLHVLATAVDAPRLAMDEGCCCRVVVSSEGFSVSPCSFLFLCVFRVFQHFYVTIKTTAKPILRVVSRDKVGNSDDDGERRTRWKLMSGDTLTVVMRGNGFRQGIMDARRIIQTEPSATTGWEFGSAQNIHKIRLKRKPDFLPFRKTHDCSSHFS